MTEPNKECARIFLRDQLRLFPEKVADNEEEALDFLLDNMATVFDDLTELESYLEEEGVDLDGERAEDLLEVFALGEGRYMYVEV